MDPQNSYTIRQAITEDYGAIKKLLESLDLPVQGVQEYLENFIVLIHRSEIIGTVGLEIYNNKALLRSLGVKKRFQNKGLGGRLYEDILKKAKNENIKEIFLLTETAEEFFFAYGFIRVSRDEVDKNVKTSIEFQSLCPESAPCMRLVIA